MALFGYPDLKIRLDISTGGALGDMSAYITEISGYSKEAILQEITAAGDSDDRWAWTNLIKKGEIVLTGPYDNTADKLVVSTREAADLGAQRTLELTFDGATAADVETVECLISKVERIPSRDALHNYSVTLRPTGAIT
tara:strand:+ start:412 stop:828 length:417 start_codon:yes stop_codon:yes gene_type:complete